MEWISVKDAVPPATPEGLSKTATESDLFVVYNLDTKSSFTGFYCHNLNGWWSHDGTYKIYPTHWLACALPKAG